MQHNPKRKRSREKVQVGIALLERIQPDAAGIDCGQNSHFVAVPPDRDLQPVRDELRAHFDRTRGLLPLPGRACRQSQGHPATARKLAVLVYRALSGRLVYHYPGAAGYYQLNRTRELKSLRKRANSLGYDLLDRATGEVLAHANPA